MLSTSKTTERRGHKRFRVSGHMVISETDQCGPIIDLSLGGLAFRYAAVPSKKQQSGTSVSATLVGEDFYISNVPLETVSISTSEKGGVTINRCNVRFGKLDPEQKKKINNFITISSLEAVKKVLKKKSAT